jgi:hypothetical protein
VCQHGVQPRNLTVSVSTRLTGSLHRHRARTPELDDKTPESRNRSLRVSTSDSTRHRAVRRSGVSSTAT